MFYSKCLFHFCAFIIEVKCREVLRGQFLTGSLGLPNHAKNNYQLAYPGQLCYDHELEELTLKSRHILSLMIVSLIPMTRMF